MIKTRKKNEPEKIKWIPFGLQGALLVGKGRALRAWVGEGLSRLAALPAPLITAVGVTLGEPQICRRLLTEWSLFWAKGKRFHLQSYFSPSVTAGDMER